MAAYGHCARAWHSRASHGKYFRRIRHGPSAVRLRCRVRRQQIADGQGRSLLPTIALLAVIEGVR